MAANLRSLERADISGDRVTAFVGVIPPHISWLHDTGERQKTACGREIEIWALVPQEDAFVLSAWATHFRQHYITDDDLPAMVDGTGLSNADYLRTVLFPDATQPPGPSLRAGDFGEILVADYIEFLMGYWSPRALRYQDRWNRNDSTKGCDIIGFKFASDQPRRNRMTSFSFSRPSRGCKKPSSGPVGSRTRSTDSHQGPGPGGDDVECDKATDARAWRDKRTPNKVKRFQNRSRAPVPPDQRRGRQSLTM